MYFLFYFNIFFLFVSISSGDKFLEKLSNIDWVCANENCSVPISLAKVIHGYSADHRLKISFKGRETVNVLGKPSDEKESIWLVSTNEKFGVVPKELLKEINVLIPSTKCTKAKYDFSVINTRKEASNDFKSDIKPSRTIEVIEGTTLSPNEDIAIPDENSSSDNATSAVISNDEQSSQHIPSENILISKHSGTYPNTLGGIIQSPLGVDADNSKSLEKEANSNDLPDVNSSPEIDPERNLLEEEKYLAEHLQKQDSSEVDVEVLDEEDSSEIIEKVPTEQLHRENIESKESSVVEEKIPAEYLPQNGSSEVHRTGSSQLDVKNQNDDFRKEESNTKNDPEESHIQEDNTNEHGNASSLQDITSSSKDDANDVLATDEKGSLVNLEKADQKSENDPYKEPLMPNNNITADNLDNDTLPTHRYTVPLEGAENNPQTPLNNLYNNAQASLENIAQATLKNNADATLENNDRPSLEINAQSSLENNDRPSLEINAQSSLENNDRSSLEINAQSSLENNEESLLEPKNIAQPSFQSNEPQISQEFRNIYPEEIVNKSEGTPVLSSLNNEPVLPMPESSPKSPQFFEKENQELDSSSNILNNTKENATEDKLYPSAPNDELGNIKHSSENSEESTSELQQQSLDSSEPPAFDARIQADLGGDKKSDSGSPASSENSLFFNQVKPSLESGNQEIQPEGEKQVPLEIQEEKVSSSETNLKNDRLSLNKLPPTEAKEDTIPSQDILAESSNWFSPVSSVMNSILEMFVKSDIGVDDRRTVQEFTTERTSDLHSFDLEKQSTFGDLQNVCEKDSFCGHSDESNPGHNEKDYQDFMSQSIPGLGSHNVSPSTLLCLIITSIAVLLFSLGYYYLENLRQDTQLAARINSLSAELFFAQKELATAEEQLTKTNENFQRLVSNTSSNEEALVKMKQELEDNEEVKLKLEQEIKRLEKEIESLVESSNEMHRMLAESISEDERTQSLLANIDDLKSVVSSKLEEISSLTNQLDKEKQEVELLTIALKKSEEKKESLEEKLDKVVNEIDSKAMTVTKEFEEKIISLERIIEENSLERANFEREIYELKQQCESLSLEKELAEKSLKKAHGLGPAKAMADWLETKEVRIELIASQKKVEKLKTELQESVERINNLQEREKELLVEIETLNNNYETAEKNKIEALTKLQVLSNYFKEKETQLQEELGEKEAQWLQKQSEDHTIYEQMRSLREENLSYKAQNEGLKREILDQEASFKIQIANEEQKAQEHWIQLRHTERRLKEAQMEAAHLRSRLTAHETNADSMEDKHNKSLDLVNGEVGLGAASPPFMLYPPPDFIPPPPLISPSRPPPLGRLSSPPLTPPPPLSPYDIFPPPPASPPPPLRVHKPQPREPPQKQKDSQSSNHSSESTDKPVRRGKR